MTSILQLIIDANCEPIESIKYEGIWGEIDSANDLDIYEKK